MWLITTFPSLKINIDNYPAVKEHLLGFGYDRLKQTGENGTRKKTNNQWFETQDSIGYWDDFFREKKIVYIEIMTDNKEEGYPFPAFSFDMNKCVILNTGYIISSKTESLECLLAILNSKVGKFLVKQYISQLQSRQFRMLSQFVNLFPIPKIANEMRENMVYLITQILNNKKGNTNSTKIEKNIDTIVYQLYELDEIEIQYIENL